MSGEFQTIINKSTVDETGRHFIQIKHQNKLYKVQIATTDEELRDVLKLDNAFFQGQEQIGLEQLEIIRDCGSVLYIRETVRNEIVAIAQILLHSSSIQEVRMQEAYSFATAGRGYGQVMFKAQEVIAREAGKKTIRTTVRVEDTETIRALLYAGYRASEYDPVRFGKPDENGARLIMSRNLVNEQFPFRPRHQAAAIRQKKVPIITSLSQASAALPHKPHRIGIVVHNRDEYNSETHHLIREAFSHSYIGIGLLQAGEFEYRVEDQTRKLLIFQREDLPPRADRLSLPVNVNSEFGRLREVIVSFTPENAQIKAEYAINDVARKNVNNIDPIAFKDEYNLFVGTLAGQSVRIVHTNAIGKDGKTPIFTRDPAYVMGDTFVTGRMKQEQRMYETIGMKEVSSEHPGTDLSEEDAAFTEGGDIIFIDDKRMVVGLGQRTNEAGLQKLREEFPDYEFIGVPHDDLHLDVLFTMVGEKKCLADVTRLPEPFLDMLRKDGFHIIEADPSEQVTLGCNVVCLANNKVVAARQNANTVQRLRENGVEVVEVSMPNLIKWGGGPRCMTCPTHREDFA